MILNRDVDCHIGKVVERIVVDEFSHKHINMTEQVVIKFTDGSKIILRADYRGSDCYISERTE